jgi:hypothetical protein
MKHIYFIVAILTYMHPLSLHSAEPLRSPGEELSLPLGLTLSIIPGFGAGNYYAKDYSKGMTFTLLDASLLSLSIWAYTSTKITDYSVLSLGVIPAVLLFFKVIQAKSAYDDIDAYNNRYIFIRP